MANFAAIIDGNNARRTRFMEKTLKTLPVFEWLRTDRQDMGDFALAWAANVNAPISVDRGREGLSVLFGEPTDRAGAGIDAATIGQRWRRDLSNGAFDGFYAAVVYGPGGRLMVGADILGLFPVYYWQKGEVTIVSSTPEVFFLHEEFQSVIDQRGLAGILLTMHSVGGRTIHTGVTRLGPGCALRVDPTGCVEITQYEPRCGMDYFSHSLSGHVDILDKCLERALQRQLRQDKTYCMTFSGGMDCRMLAGYLREMGIRPAAITFGKATDIEMRIARAVAAKMKMSHRMLDLPYQRFCDYAARQAKWEHLNGGFNAIYNYGLEPQACRAERIVLGHCLDAVIGSQYLSWCCSPQADVESFESFFGHINSWGLNIKTLSRLLHATGAAQTTAEIKEQIRRQYYDYAGLDSHRVWRFNLAHRQRFHVGSAAWVYSFSAWPVVPALDRELVDAAGSMPAASLSQRRAQIELFCRKFADLASMPVDRNSYDTTPLRPRLRYMIMACIYNRMKRFLPGRPGASQIERRYYYRIYDINNPGWQAVRSRAENYRRMLYPIFRPDVLHEVLPAPGNKLALSDGIINASGLKTLIGLMLWCKEHKIYSQISAVV